MDNVGNNLDLYWQSHHFLTESGKYVQVGTPAINFAFVISLTKVFLWPKLLGSGKRRFSVLGVTIKKADIAKLMEWMLQGKIKAEIDERYCLKDFPRSFEKLKTGKASGKLVVDVPEHMKALK